MPWHSSRARNNRGNGETVLTDDQKAEVRAALNQVLAVYKGDDEDPEMPPLTFATARDVALHANDYEMYADHVAWRVSRVRVLLAACEDIADALGDLEEDEALAAVRPLSITGDPSQRHAPRGRPPASAS